MVKYKSFQKKKSGDIFSFRTTLTSTTRSTFKLNHASLYQVQIDTIVKREQHWCSHEILKQRATFLLQRKSSTVQKLLHITYNILQLRWLTIITPIHFILPTIQEKPQDWCSKAPGSRFCLLFWNGMGHQFILILRSIVEYPWFEIILPSKVHYIQA